ncbi:MAG: rhamnulokinase [Candidatus Doudnabacteria bacterium]|nr:rhamnulokinase [Candidatus Doudnabacteria bacterium]
MNYLAFDLGAESGRAILGVVSKDSIALKEMHRFPTKTVIKNKRLCWDTENIFSEIKNALKKIAKQNIKLSGIGVDTWGVDYGLVDKNGKLLHFPVSYRDVRTDGAMEKVFKILPKEKIYKITGIQFLPFNTLYQLYAENKSLLKKADKLLFIPDLINFYLTGKVITEKTIASTSQVLSHQGKLSEEILNELNLPKKIMPEFSNSIVGKLKNLDEDIKSLSGTPVFSIGSHDTASAVAAVPVINRDNWAFLSSGTWSLLGAETPKAIINKNTLEKNFTNEKGVFNTNRFLKNIAGLWLLQKCKKEWEQQGKKFTYTELTQMAKRAPSFKSLIPVNHKSFLHPKSMTKAIVEFCKRTKQPAPSSPREFTCCILESLSLEYKKTLLELESLVGKRIQTLHILGGGSQNELLNQFAASATGKVVKAGPVEATALGNIMVQAILNEQVRDLKSARKIIAKSIELKTYKPQNTKLWSKAYIRYTKLNYEL